MKGKPGRRWNFTCRMAGCSRALAAHRSRNSSGRSTALEQPIVGGIVNGELRELTYPIEMEARLRPVTLGEPDGMRIYRRSLTFLLASAFEELFPGAWLTVDHSVSSGGYFCQVRGRPDLDESDLDRLEQRMRQLAEADLPFGKEQVPLAEAIELFRQRGYVDKVRLLSHRRKPWLVLYSLGDHRDYHHGYMVPRTGYLRRFGLTLTDGGFTLRFPRRHAADRLLPLPEYPKLLATFRQYGDWLEKLGISYVGALNDAIRAGKGSQVVLVSEALHEQHISAIAGEIARRQEEIRVVLIAGPSASGKTTFSKRLSVQLLARGLRPFALELDNFFVDREATPRGEDGAFDFEALEALDLERLNHDLQALVAGETVRLPRYDFKRGVQDEGQTARLEAGQILLLEGIHGLNPALTPRLPAWPGLPHLRLGPDPAQPRPPQPRLDHRHPPDPAHRARCRAARLQRRRDDPALGIGAARREALHLPLPGERRRHVQLGAGLRSLGAGPAGRTAAAPGALRDAGARGSQAPAGVPGVVPAAAADLVPDNSLAAGVHRPFDLRTDYAVDGARRRGGADPRIDPGRVGEETGVPKQRRTAPGDRRGWDDGGRHRPGRLAGRAARRPAGLLRAALGSVRWPTCASISRNQANAKPWSELVTAGRCEDARPVWTSSSKPRRKSWALKQTIFAELDRLCPPPALLATNTSTLSVTAIASAAAAAERVAGLHFFNPPPLMPLVEVARGARTTDATIEQLGRAGSAARQDPGGHGRYPRLHRQPRRPAVLRRGAAHPRRRDRHRTIRSTASSSWAQGSAWVRSA